jgi:hypothetical protein
MKKETLNIEEISNQLKKEGIDIKPRKFEYYQGLGLFPKPSKKEVGKKEVGKKKGGVYGRYDADVIINYVKKFQKLKEEKYMLDEILELMQKEILDKYSSAWRKFQYSYPLLKTEGVSHREPPCFSGNRLLRKLPLWATKEEVEILALKDMNREAYALKRGLRKALISCEQEKSKYSGNKKAVEIITGLMEKINEEINKLTIVQKNAKADLSKIQEGQQIEGRKKTFKDASNSYEVSDELE